MFGESVAYPTHATFVQVAGEGTWTSNAQKLTNNLRTKKESWLNIHFTDQAVNRLARGSPCLRTAIGEMLSKDATLA